MARVDDMLASLPQLYRDGELVRKVLGLPALQLEILGEDALEVQRAHWFDSALELREVAALTALLDFAPEPWQLLSEYRAWVRGLRDAMIEEGAVTKKALRNFIVAYSRANQEAFDIFAVPELKPPEKPEIPDKVFVEFPRRRRYDRAPLAGGIDPLHQFTITQRGLDETVAAFLLVGLPSGPECVPVIANTTTAQALIFMDNLPPGQRLWIKPDGGFVTAMLEGRDVTAKMRSISGIEPGVAWSSTQVEQPARSLKLARGTNNIWFLPVAQFDALGLDRFLLALADLLLHQGRYDETQFGHALFYQDPAALLRIAWEETEPASFEVRLPAGVLRSRSGELDPALEARDRLGFSLDEAVQKLKAAGVKANLELTPFAEVQGQAEFLTGTLPLVHREVGPTGADELPDAGGLFGVTPFQDSTYR
jgi:hypothetical protein